MPKYTKEQWQKFKTTRLMPENTERLKSLQKKMGNMATFNFAANTAVEAGLPIVEKRFGVAKRILSKAGAVVPENWK